MEINNYNSSTENPTESIENRYNYYSSDEPISLELCNQDIIDYIENGGNLPVNISSFDVKKSLSLLSESTLSEESIKRFMELNNCLAEDVLDIRVELVAPRDMYFYVNRKADYINHEDANCKDSNPELFFPSASNKSQVTAKKPCNACPEKDNCLRTALENDEDGIWGGTNKSERSKLYLNEQKVS